MILEESAIRAEALSRSISPVLGQYKGMEKWNRILFQVSGGAVPLIDLGKMEGCRADRKEAKDKRRVQSSGANPVKSEWKGS
jgi:hypothetical protein